MKKYIILISVLLINGCSARVSGSHEFSMQVNTFDNDANIIASSCKLYSSETRIEFNSPNKIVYQANCGPLILSVSLKSLRRVWIVTRDRRANKYQYNY